VVDWGDIPLVAALPPHADASADPLPLNSLNGQVVILPRRTAAVPSLPEAVDEAFALHSVTPAAIRHTETIQTGLPLIEAGLAVGVLPDPDSKSLERFNITVRTLEPAPKPLRALLLLRREARENPMVTRFLKTTRDLDGD
jgi:DNA-binding transcriptional LysR family regulator